MKKVLSVLLAAAMVMGMSVSAMAANYTWGSNGTGTVDASVNKVVEFDDLVYVVRNGNETPYAATADSLSLNAGDDLYFPLMWYNGGTKENFTNFMTSTNDKAILAKHDTATCKADWHYCGPIDSNWSINILADDYYVDGASFYTYPTTAPASGLDVFGNAYAPSWAGFKFVKVSIADEFVSTSKTIEFDFTLYLADGIYESNNVTVYATYSGAANGGTVSYTSTNNAAAIAKWTAPAKKGTAVFDFSDKVYFTVDMLAEEAVILNLSTAYNKNVDALFSNAADMDFYNFKGSKDAFYKTGELFIPADEDTFIYEILSDVDDEEPELVAVDATYDDEYTIAGVNKEFEGWVIDTDELGYYVVVDEELVVEEEEVEAPVVEDNKANPETGANDFVGAAVALAVVSVAAAGALALKK